VCGKNERFLARASIDFIEISLKSRTCSVREWMTLKIVGKRGRQGHGKCTPSPGVNGLKVHWLLGSRDLASGDRHTTTSTVHVMLSGTEFEIKQQGGKGRTISDD